MIINNDILLNTGCVIKDLEKRGLQLKILCNAGDLYSLFGGRRRFVRLLIDSFKGTEYSEYYKDYKTTSSAFGKELNEPGLIIFAICNAVNSAPLSLMIVNDFNVNNVRFQPLLYNLLLFSSGEKKYIEMNADLILKSKNEYISKIDLLISTFIKNQKIELEHSDCRISLLAEYCKLLTADDGAFFLYNLICAYYSAEYVLDKINFDKVAGLLKFKLRELGYSKTEICAVVSRIEKSAKSLNKTPQPIIPVSSINRLIKKSTARLFLFRLLTNRRILYLSWLLSFCRGSGSGIGMLNHQCGIKILSGISEYNNFFGTSLNRRFFPEYCSNKVGGCGFYWVGPVVNKDYAGAGFANSL